MRWATAEGCRRAHVSLDVANIHRSGSVTGMQARFGWPKGGQVRVGSYIYNVGVDAVMRLRGAGELHG